MTAGPGRESTRALDGFSERGGSELELLCERGREIEIVLQIRAHSIRAQRSLGELGELLGKLLRCGERAAGGNHAVDETDRERLGGRDRAPGQDQIQSAREADQAREPDGAAVDQRNAEATAEHAEDRVVIGDAEVTPQRELQATGDCMTGDRCDHWLPEEHSRRSHRSVAVRGDAIRVARGQRLEIRTGAERPVLPGKDRDACIRIRIERAERVCQLQSRLAIDSVLRRAAIDHHRGDGPLPFRTDHPPQLSLIRHTFNCMSGCKRIAILSSGGDAPGMNAAIRAAALVGRSLGADILGIERGYKGLLDGAFVPLMPGDVQAILREGGTILGSARCKEFHHKEVRDKARANLANKGVDGLIVIGGNGSLTGALHLADPTEIGDGPSLKVIGVPASIDNDLGLTGMCIGVDTAMNTIVEACDKIADTATAHDRTFIIEVMGRDCGYLAMTSAIAVGADLALFPESGKPEAAIIDQIVNTVLTVRSRSRKSRRVIIIKAEGVSVPTERLKDLVDAALREKIPGSEPGMIETRVTVLGHVVRGGRPSAFDRLLGSRLGNVAVRALVGGISHKMTAWMPPDEVPEEVGSPSAFDPKIWLVDLAAVLVETENLIMGRSPLTRWRAGAFDQIGDALLL